MFVKSAAVAASLLAPALAFPLEWPSVFTKRQNAAAHLVQYVQTFTDESSSSTPLSIAPLLDDNTRVTHVLLAALHINSGDPTGITLNDNNPNSSYYDNIWSEAATLQQNGIKVMFMMGGAAAGTYSTLCDSSGNIDMDYYGPLRSTIAYHNVDGIDLDIEQSTPIACAENLITQFKSDFGSSFIVTMAPVATDMTSTNSGLSGFSYKDLDATAAGQMVDWYNVQYYSGFVEGSIEESYEGAISNGFSASRIIMGVLDASSDGSGFVSLSDLQSTISNLLGQYSDFGGVDGWEYYNAGSSDGLSDPWMWTQDIGNSLFGGSSKKRSSDSSAFAGKKLHYSPLSAKHKELMKMGYGQIESAKALRYANDDLAEAKKILKAGQ